MNSNPYKPAESVERQAAYRPSHRALWAMVGFALVCLPLAALGAYSLYQESRIAATLPSDVPRCGTGAAIAMVLIFPVSPMFGCVGAAIGFFAAIVRDCILMAGATDK